MDQEPAAQIASILLHFLLPCKFSPCVERPEMVSILLHHGADPNFRRGMGSYQTTTWLNVLGHISKYGASQIMRLLIMAGADLGALRGVAHCLVITEYPVKDAVVPQIGTETRAVLMEIGGPKSLRDANQSEEDENTPPRKNGSFATLNLCHSLLTLHEQSPKSLSDVQARL